MLSQLKRLSLEVDGRYASDAELQFIVDYVQSYNLRLQTYQKLQELEPTIVHQTLVKMKSVDPNFFNHNGNDVSSFCKRDVTFVMRYIAITVLLDDIDSLQEQLLFWFQTIMRALRKERYCNIAYSALQDVLKQHLSPPQANLVVPLVELNRRTLSAAA